MKNKIQKRVTKLSFIYKDKDFSLKILDFGFTVLLKHVRQAILLCLQGLFIVLGSSWPG